MSNFTIHPQKPEDVSEVADLLTQVWLDTYPNKEFNVTRDWILQRRAIFGSKEKIAKRQQHLRQHSNNKKYSSFVAKDESGRIIGFVHMYIDDEGGQNLGAIYVLPEYHGKGVAQSFMQKLFEWADGSKPIKLGVVKYNERAKAFYRKWGFEEIPGEHLFGHKLPEIFMIRPGENATVELRSKIR